VSVREATRAERAALEALQRRSSDGTAIGFSVVIPADGAMHELDGLFVEPAHMRRGVGRALVEHAAARAARDGAARLEVIAGPAQGFYERLDFTVIDSASTRFGPAVRMRRDLSLPRRHLA
jgi:GNAT superfamily N-acetyltransferase